MCIYDVQGRTVCIYTLSGAKNMVRIFEAGFSKNLKNTEPLPKFSYSYKKKRVGEFIFYICENVKII